MAKEFKLCGHRPAYWETKCPECGADGPVVIWNGTEEAKKYWDDFVQKGLEEVKPSASSNNKRDVICSCEVCDYCIHERLNCKRAMADASCFEGRKLTPVL